jgi:hypothetical protein
MNLDSSNILWNKHLQVFAGNYYNNFITEDWLTKQTNITTKWNWKLCSKVIKRPSEEAWVLDRQSVLIKREAQALLWRVKTRAL